MRPGRLAVALACLLAGRLSRGMRRGVESSTSSAQVAAKSLPAPPASEFPSAKGKTLKGCSNRPKAAPTWSLRRPRKPSTGAEPLPLRSLRTANELPSPTPRSPSTSPKAPPKTRNGAAGKKKPSPLGHQAIGPFPAAVESLATKPAFRAKTTTEDPNAAPVVYAAEPNFPSDGEWRIVALIKEGNKTTWTVLPSATVGEFTSPAGRPAGAADPHADGGERRRGPLEDHDARPAGHAEPGRLRGSARKRTDLLLFATPKFCQSRVCGPVVDVAEQVKQLTKARRRSSTWRSTTKTTRARGCGPRCGVPPAHRALAVRDRPRRHVRSEIEGAFGVGELTQLVKEVIGE